MIISGTFREFDKGGCSDRCQRSVNGIEQGISRSIIGWLNPFSLKDSPKCFCYVEMRGIRRQEEQEQSSLLPYFSHLHHKFGSVYLGVVQNNKSFLFDRHGEPVKVVNELLRSNALSGGEAMIGIGITDHTEYIEPGLFLRWDTYLLPWEHPTERHITFGTHMALISKIKVNQSFIIMIYKLLQLLAFISIELRRGFSLWPLPYTSKSCAKADKKLLKVLRLASLPVADCHLSLAFITLSLSFWIASMTFSVSVESMIGLAPCPGLLRSPSIPEARYRFTQRLTVRTDVCNSSAMDCDERPSDFFNTYRQRFCIKGRGSKCMTYSNSTRCFFVRLTSLIFIAFNLSFMQKSCHCIIINS